jgi:hypothetical protein
MCIGLLRGSCACTLTVTCLWLLLCLALRSGLVWEACRAVAQPGNPNPTCRLYRGLRQTLLYLNRRASWTSHDHERLL